MKKVYAANPLLCQRCGGTMRIPAFAKASTYAEASVDKWVGKPLMRRLTAPWCDALPTYQGGSVFTVVNTERGLMT